MKQKVVIEVHMKCEKCRSKALEIAVAKDVALTGKIKNQIEVIGDGIVDAAGLAETLRRKVGFAYLVSVEELN